MEIVHFESYKTYSFRHSFHQLRYSQAPVVKRQAWTQKVNSIQDLSKLFNNRFSSLFPRQEGSSAAGPARVHFIGNCRHFEKGKLSILGF